MVKNRRSCSGSEWCFGKSGYSMSCHCNAKMATNQPRHSARHTSSTFEALLVSGGRPGDALSFLQRTKPPTTKRTNPHEMTAMTHGSGGGGGDGEAGGGGAKGESEGGG